MNALRSIAHAYDTRRKMESISYFLLSFFTTENKEISPPFLSDPVTEE
jgi:hypothetical protein